MLKFRVSWFILQSLLRNNVLFSFHSVCSFAIGFASMKIQYERKTRQSERLPGSGIVWNIHTHARSILFAFPGHSRYRCFHLTVASSLWFFFFGSILFGPLETSREEKKQKETLLKLYMKKEHTLKRKYLWMPGSRPGTQRKGYFLSIFILFGVMQYVRAGYGMLRI